MTWSGDPVPRLKIPRMVLTSLVGVRAEVCGGGEALFKYSSGAHIGK